MVLVSKTKSVAPKSVTFPNGHKNFMVIISNMHLANHSKCHNLQRFRGIGGCRATEWCNMKFHRMGTMF